MSQISKIFNYEEMQLRTVAINGEPWFVAKDVCDVLEINDARKSVNLLDEDERNIIPVTDHLGRKQETFIINEPGLYSLILRSRKPEAKQFKRWITHEVIPSIRKNGGYIATNENDTDEDILARAVLVAQKTIEKKNQIIANQQKQLDEQEPLVSFAKVCMQSNQSIKVGELAKLMASHGIDTGQKRLFVRLRQWGMVFKNSTEPTQKAIESGYFEIAQGVKQKPNGEAFTWRTPYVTPKGQLYIVNRLQKEAS